MIYLTKNSINQVILELTQVSNLVTSYYLFQLVNDLNVHNITYFTSPDQSNYKCRYNQFTIIETGSSFTTNVSAYVADGYLEEDYITLFTDLTASTINLEVGQYTYNVFEAPQPTVYLSGTTGQIISTGKCIVHGPDNNKQLVYK